MRYRFGIFEVFRRHYHRVETRNQTNEGTRETQTHRNTGTQETQAHRDTGCGATRTQHHSDVRDTGSQEHSRGGGGHQSRGPQETHAQKAIFQKRVQRKGRENDPHRTRTRETRGTREHRNAGTQETRERRDTGVHETQEPTKVRDQGSPSGNAIKICFRVW